jgi:CubicO group peptidase (beta-lactamase class C family)
MKLRTQSQQFALSPAIRVGNESLVPPRGVTGRPVSIFPQMMRTLTAAAIQSLVMAAVLLGGESCRAEELNADKAARIDELVSRYRQCGYLNGAVLVAQGGRVIYEKGVGEANFESHAPNTPRTKFGIASITKQFTAALVLQQVAKGNIRLEGTVSDYLPWYRKDTGSRMTIEQLLQHTSGLPADYDHPQFSDSAEAARHSEPQDFAKKFCQPALVAEAGTKWAYSNCGYILLGLILEQVTRQPFSNLLGEQILVPLGMKNTGMDNNDLTRMGGAAGYVRHAGPRYSPGPYLDRGHIFSAGSMYSTVEDLFIWNQALSRGDLFPKELRERIFKPGMSNWANGWFVTRIPQGVPGAGSTLVEMRGDMPGNFFAWIMRYPDQDVVVIVLRNAYGSTEHFEEKLQAVLFDQQPSLPLFSPKDVIAHGWYVTYRAVTAHPLIGLVVVSCFVVGLWKYRKSRLVCPGLTT